MPRIREILRIMIGSRRLCIISFMENRRTYLSAGHSDVEHTHTSMKSCEPEKEASTFLGPRQAVKRGEISVSLKKAGGMSYIHQH